MENDFTGPETMELAAIGNSGFEVEEAPKPPRYYIYTLERIRI